MLPQHLAYDVEAARERRIAEGAAGSSGRAPGRVPVNDFSGLVSAICALAKAAARAAIDSLDRCIARLPFGRLCFDYLEADRSRLGALSAGTFVPGRRQYDRRA